MTPSPENPPPGPDPERVLREHQEFAPPAGDAAPQGGYEPPPQGPSNRQRIGFIVLAALALGLGVTTAVLAGRGPEKITTTHTVVSTTKLKPTTTTVVTEVSTNTTTTKTTTETTDTVTETVTEAGPPGQEKPKPPKPKPGKED